MADQETPVVPSDDADTKLSNLVNSAVASHLKRHTKGFADQLGTMLDERLAAFKPAAPAAAPGNAAPAADPMQEVEKLRGELKAQKVRAAEKEVFADVRSYLSGKVRPEAMDTAIKLLKADGSIKVDARDSSAKVKHAELGDLDLHEGLSEWLKGEGAIFAPVQAAKKPPIKGPHRAPVRGNGGAETETLTPAQKSLQALQARGLSLT